MSAYVFWSIYVQTSNKRKLLESHLPPIAEALENIEFDWEISTEPENPGLFRLIMFQNIDEPKVEGVVVTVLRRAFKLSRDWQIGGLEDLSAGKVRHFYGACTRPKISNTPPALNSLMFEVEPGKVLAPTEDGGWPIVGRVESDAAKDRQIRWPKAPESKD